MMEEGAPLAAWERVVRRAQSTILQPGAEGDAKLGDGINASPER